MTKTERKLWYNYLRTLPVRVLRQKPLDGFIVDFYCAKAKLVIEVDGGYHFFENSMYYDQQRTLILEKYGLKVIRFTNKEVTKNFRAVCNEIEKEISHRFRG